MKEKRMKSGLADCISVLEDIEGICVVALENGDIVRNPLVRKIVAAYEERDRLLYV